MGEAKRRQQKLGEGYGKVPPVLTVGSQQYEQQVEQFTVAWLDHMEATYGEVKAESQQNTEDVEAADDDQPLPPEASQALHDKTQAWITIYLAPYRVQDRYKLIAGLLDPHYAELHEFFQQRTATEAQTERVKAWMIEALTLYSMFKAHLSPAQQKTYSDPLKSFYGIAMEEATAKNDELQIKDLNILFSPCL